MKRQTRGFGNILLVLSAISVFLFTGFTQAAEMGKTMMDGQKMMMDSSKMMMDGQKMMMDDMMKKGMMKPGDAMPGDKMMMDGKKMMMDGQNMMK